MCSGEKCVKCVCSGEKCVCALVKSVCVCALVKSVCVCSGEMSSYSTTIKDAVFCSLVFDVSSLLFPFPPTFPVMKEDH